MIDHAKIAKAEEYYAKVGFQKIDVPWIVGREAYQATFPLTGNFPYFTLGGFLPASGEQCFVQLLLDGRLPQGKYQCTTPCFRDELEEDELHLPYFYKVELIEVTDEAGRYMELAHIAFDYFTQYCSVEYEYLPAEQTDIIEHYTGIELGSYGRRHYKGLVWNYGTGLAEPRLSQVLAKIQPDQK